MAKVASGRVRDFKAIALADLSAEQVAYCHLSTRGWEPIKGYTLHTILADIETEMRQSRGTNLTSRYVPLLAAFAILEQLGDTYEDKQMEKHSTAGSGIERALYYFCGFAAMGPEVKALKALRHGLVHSASLTSTDAVTHDRYLFRYDYKMAQPIRLAKKPWDGQLSTVNPDIMTVINPRQFTDLVSSAISKVRDLLWENPKNLRIRRLRRAILICHLIWTPDLADDER